MPLYINTNTLSLNAQRNLFHNTDMLSKSMEHLSSGFRINRAGDDAAGLQLSENLRVQIRGSEKALANVQDGIGVLNIADGAMQTFEDNLQRVRELLVQAANDTYSQTQRDALAQEISQLLSDNDRIADTTVFDGVHLLNDQVPVSQALAGPGFLLQVGPNADPVPAPPVPQNTIDIASALVDLTSDGVAGYGVAMQAILASGNPMFVDGVPPMLNGQPAGAGAITTNAEAQEMMVQIDAAINEVNIRRGNLGAIVSRLNGAVNNLSVSIENLSASEAHIRDVDVAAESAKLTQYQILQQSAALVLSQANQTPALALQLLKGQ